MQWGSMCCGGQGAVGVRVQWGSGCCGGLGAVEVRVQWGSGRIPVRWRCARKQSCATHSGNSATAFLQGQSVALDISCAHSLWHSLVSNSCLYVLRNACFNCSLIEL